MRKIPIMLSPSAKDYLWGGERLNDDYNFGIKISPFAEAWVCSTHPEGESKADGQNLSDVLKQHPEYLGTHPLAVTGGKPTLPILIKLIDANTDLSVQVHPCDEYALVHEGELGKTEMWYVLDAKPESEIVYGFNQKVTHEKVLNAIEKGTISNLLNHIQVKKNNVYYIEAGTVHAIGAGCLIAEIQENSNVTYRLYDYDRLDKNGKKRQLHVKKAMQVANLRSSVAPRQPLRAIKYRNGCASELLTRCKYFQVERMLLNTEIQRTLVPYRTGTNSFHALLCVNGCGSISWKDGSINFFKGDCFFIPADSEALLLHGKAEFLDVCC